MKHFSVAPLGTSAAITYKERGLTAQLLKYENRLILIDCGEGTQFRLKAVNAKLNKLTHIFISHLHGDHFFGLIGLISSMHLLSRRHTLHVYGPPMLKEILDLLLQASETTLRFPLQFHPTQADKPQKITAIDNLDVISFPLDHRIPTTGFLFRERVEEKNIRVEALKKYRIPVARLREIQLGADFTDSMGNVIPNSELTHPSPGRRSYAYCSDTAFKPDIVPVIRGVNLLYHEATFMEPLREMAAEKKHATAREAAEIARMANAHKLMLGHFSARYADLSLLLDEAKAVFPDSYVAVDLEEVLIS